MENRIYEKLRNRVGSIISPRKGVARDLILQDILRCIHYGSDGKVSIYISSSGYITESNGQTIVHYDIDRPLRAQDVPTLNTLIDLIKQYGK